MMLRTNNFKDIDTIYKQYKFNPVSHNILKKSEFLKLHKQRMSLFVDHLKLPSEIFFKKKVIEFGPASGEKSIFYSIWGADLTVVEPNQKFIKQFKKNFMFFKKKFKILNKKIENYESKKKFDIIILENFLSSTRFKNSNLNKVSRLLNKNGYLIFNYHNTVGFFNEYLKKFVLSYYLNKHNINDLDKSLLISKEFFFKYFKKINHTRSFKKYMLDQFLLNHFLHKTFWDIKKIFKVANLNNLRFYSSNPSYVSFKDSWYKTIKKNKQFNQDILLNYYRIENNFIDHKFTFTDNDKKIILEIQKLMIKGNENQNYEEIIERIIKKISTTKSNKFLILLKKLMKNINPKTFKTFLGKTSWGYPNHYIVFRKV